MCAFIYKSYTMYNFWTTQKEKLGYYICSLLWWFSHIYNFSNMILCVEDRHLRLFIFLTISPCPSIHVLLYSVTCISLFWEIYIYNARCQCVIRTYDRISMKSNTIFIFCSVRRFILNRHVHLFIVYAWQYLIENRFMILKIIQTRNRYMFDVQYQILFSFSTISYKESLQKFIVKPCSRYSILFVITLQVQQRNKSSGDTPPP